MKFSKTHLQNNMEDGWLNHLMICYIEKEKHLRAYQMTTSYIIFNELCLV